MATQTLSLGNFGQSGWMPDLAPSLLPQTGFSYSANWRFTEGGRAVVTNGYNNALSTRQSFGDSFELANENAELTFMFTWELSRGNSIIVYDGNDNRMKLLENSGDGSLVEFNLSVEEDVSYPLTYTSSNTPTNGEFTIDGSGNLVLNFLNAAPANIATIAGISKEVAISDVSRNKPMHDRSINTNATVNGTTVTVTPTDPIAASFFIDGVEYFLRFAEPYIHDNSGNFLWEGTDALGVPVFNNEVEAPWQLVEGVVFPKIQELTNWPQGGRCKSFSSFGAVLAAVGYINTETSVGFRGGARTVAFSNPIIDAGDLPTWDFAVLDSQATILDLALFSDGALVSGFESNNIFVVNGTTDIISVTDNGDGSYGGTKLEIGGGTLTKRTSVAVPNGFFNIGNGDFYFHDTSSYTQIGHGAYSDTWFQTVDEARLSEVQVEYDSRTRSVWIKTPTSDVTQEIWIITLDNNNSLSRLDDHQELKFLEWSAEGTPAVSATWDTISAASWDNIEENAWHDYPIVELGDFRNRMLSCGGNRVFVNDFGQTFNGRAINAVLEKAYFKLGASDSYGTFQFDRVVPWIDGGEGDVVEVRVGSAQTVGSPTTHTPYKAYRVGITDKLDFRRQAKWGSITFQCRVPGVSLAGAEIKVNSASRR